MRPILTLTIAGLITACTPMTPPETDLPFFGDGYRAEGDQCRQLGEDAFTGEFLDHTADLVGCPEDMENLGVFITETGAIEVARKDGYILFSVPVS
ncbi:MAG: hypothetical protein AAF340_16890 [Pseudomonadota bacterium]